MKNILFAMLIMAQTILFAQLYDTHSMIIKTTQTREINRGKFGLAELDSYMERYEVKEVKSILRKNNNQYYLVYTEKPIDFNQLETKKFSGVEYTQPNYLNRMFVTPNDPLYYQQHLGNVNLPRAWNYTIGNREVVVAIIDSGLHFDHPDLQENIWLNPLENADSGIDDDGNGYIDDWRGWDFVDAPEWEAIAFGDFVEQDNEPFDDNNHGTHVAGIIGASTNNEEGIAGVCWNVKLMILRAGFNSLLGGYLQDDDAAAALIYAADMGADVISLSWGDINYSPIIADACQYAYNKGSIIVAAAGNDASSPIVYPARLSTTIAVGAVDQNNNLATFSSYGPNLDLVAPGVQIMSTFDVTEGNLYQYQSGTSMSAPFVSGAIALLLSEEPDLTFEEVKVRLAVSSKDLGTLGNDIYFGYGLLDVYRLLTVSNLPLVKIDTPRDFESFSESFDITGTVLMDNFKYYTVMYTTETEPAEIDWKNVSNHLNTPHRYYDEVENGLLARFSVDELVALPFEYQIRVRAFNSFHDIYEYKRTVRINKTPPIFFAERSGIEKRYDGEKSVFYIQTVYSQPVMQRLEFTDGMHTFETFSADYDSIHVQKIPDFSPNGIYQASCFAENEVGHSISEAIPFDIEIEHYSIDTGGFEQINLSQTLLITRDYTDFDGSGRFEFLAYEKEGNENTLSVFEVDSDTLITKYTFPEFITPRAIGNTNQYGKEILGVVGDNARLYETDSGSVYPNQLIYTWSDTYGADFIDFDGDGIGEVALVKDAGGLYARRVVQVFKRTGNTFTLHATLENSSGGVAERNIFVPKVVAGNLNGNSIPDLLTADQEGDMMIFENGELTWLRKSPVPNTFFLGIGNFTGQGDGIEDFCVGGYAFNPDNPSMSLAYFEFFRYDFQEETYRKIGYVSFDDIAVRNSIAIADITEDGTDEIIIDVPPNIYIVDFVVDNGAGEFRPIWKGESASELQNTIVAFPATETQAAHIVANRMVDGELKSNIIRRNQTDYPLSVPQLFSVQPVNESSVMITWQENEMAQSYKVYRKTGEEIELLETVLGGFYLDMNLTAGELYKYQITSYHEAETPPESMPTVWKEAIPFYPPSIASIEMISSNEIRVIFDQELRNDALLRTNFEVNNNYGFPHSVNWAHGHHGVVLNFGGFFVDPDEHENTSPYELKINQLFGRTNVPYQDNDIIPVVFRKDVNPPRIVQAEKIGERAVAIYFNEALDQLSAETPEHYILVMPAADADNSVEQISYQQSGDQFWTTITLRDKPALTNQQYFLKINHVQDLAGNTISNSGNKIAFSLNDITKLAQHVVAPNPYETNKYNETRFFLPVEKAGKIAIYDLSGAIVFEDSFKPLSRLQNFYAWNGRNTSNQRVSSGMYFYIIRMENEVVRGKIAVIN
jgi:subtilisin family serine protease/fibronectin type 3 domain-containing protein